MKLILREYLSSLKEREELDAVLPDLLSELGFNVYSRPMRGTSQHGVDIAAIGEDNDEKKLFLFSVKQGDLTRQDWDGVASQSLRPSLNQIRDVYIRTKIPQQHKNLKVVICLCFGGDIQENIRLEVAGYIEDNTTDRISFQEWNGDKLAELLLQGVLREKLLPKPMRADFQKAVAMVDHPDVAHRHFARLAAALRQSSKASAKARVTAARQLYIALWVLFVWARDVDNVEAPYRASELAILSAWEILRSDCGKKPNRQTNAIGQVFAQLVHLHLIITTELFGKKILPHVEKRHALSTAVHSQSPVDVNLALFETLGRLAMWGLWAAWLNALPTGTIPESAKAAMVELQGQGFKLIANNPALCLPSNDRQATDVALFLLLALHTDAGVLEIADWLSEMVERLYFTVMSHGRYPITSSDYADLVDHPREATDAYRQEVTAASTLIPLIGAWLTALGREQACAKLDRLTAKPLAHCTLQLWLPDRDSEDLLYVGGGNHGLALTGLPASGETLLSRIGAACRANGATNELSAMAYGRWPLALLAFRHHGLPIPPHFWIQALKPPADADAGSEAST
jgi:hypothetical protein